MEITRYNTDSGNRDLEGETMYGADTPFIDILQKASELRAPLIVKTSYINAARPGAWYVKGYNSIYTYEEIKTKIDDNVRNKKHTKRVCYLINYL
jgi:hypothetical protein